jgi:sec-independent protein translocase protein TatA
MGGLSLVHWVILMAVVLLFFGAGRLPNVMGDFAKGIKAFRSGMRDDEHKSVTEQVAAPAPAAANQTVGSHATIEGERKAG